MHLDVVVFFCPSVVHSWSEHTIYDSCRRSGEENEAEKSRIRK